MSEEALVLSIDPRPAEDGGRRYARTIDDVTRANDKAEDATSKLEARFRSLARTTADGTKSAAGWVLHHSLLLGTVGLLSRGLSVVTTGAMAAFLGMTGKVSEALANATSYAALFAAKGLRSLSALLTSAGGGLAGFAGGLATGATWLERWGALTLKLSIGMVALGAAAAVVAAKITSAATAAGNDFIPAWNRVLTLAKGTPAELRKLRGELESLASELGVNQAEAARQYYEVLSALPEAIENPAAGLKVLEAALKASATGFTTTEDAISAITGVLYNYNLAADQAGAVADALFKAQDLGSLTFGEVASSISQAAPLVSALGGSYQDLLAITALVTRGQTTTSEAMTQVSSAMGALLTQTGPAAQASKELGIQFDAAAVQAKGLAGFLLDIIDKTNGHPEVLAKFFGRKEAITLLVSLAQRTDELRQVVAETADSAGGAERVYQQMNETLDRQVELLQGPYKRALLDLGIVMDRTAIGALKLMNRFQNFVGGLDFRKMFAVADAPLFADSVAFGTPSFAAPRIPTLSTVHVAGPTRPAPEAATVDDSTTKIQALQDSLHAAAIAAVDASGNFAAYDRSLIAADKSVNALVISEMARLKAAGVEQSEVNKLAALYKDTYSDARKAAEEHRRELEKTAKELEKLTIAASGYQAAISAPAGFGAGKSGGITLSTDARDQFIAGRRSRAETEPNMILHTVAVPAGPGAGDVGLFDRVKSSASQFAGGDIKGGLGTLGLSLGPLAVVAAALVPVFKGLKDALGPAIQTLVAPLEIVGHLLGTVLTPVLKLVAPPLKLIAKVASYVVEGLGYIVLAAGKAAGALSFGIAGKGLRRTGDEIIAGARDARASLENMGNAADKLAASLSTDLPKAINLALYRARIGAPGGGVGGGGSTPGGGSYPPYVPPTVPGHRPPVPAGATGVTMNFAAGSVVNQAGDTPEVLAQKMAKGAQILHGQGVRLYAPGLVTAA